MAVLYPKIVNAYTLSATSVSYQESTTLLAKNTRHPYSVGMAKLVWESNVLQYIVKPT